MFTTIGVMRRIEVRFTGRVQGVGFRATVSAIARKFPVSGWVRNEQDGSVRLVAEGTSESLDAFVMEIQSRMYQYIKGTERLESAPLGERGFEVRR